MSQVMNKLESVQVVFENIKQQNPQCFHKVGDCRI